MPTISIVHKLLFWFLILAIVPIVLLSYFNYQTAAEAINQQIKNSLVAIADSKTEAIETIIRNIQANVSVLTQSPLIAQTIIQLQSPNPSLSNRYTNFLRAITEDFGYKEIILTDARGKILFSKSGIDQLPRPSELFQVFERATTLVELSSSDFQPQGNLLIAYVAVPILDNQNAIIGTVIVGFTNDSLLSVTANYTGLGKTGETLLVTKSNGIYQLIAPTRNDGSPQPDQLAQIPSIQQAVNGTSGFGVNLDYRSRQVLEAWQYVATINGGLVVKIDTDEALASVRDVRNSTIIFSLSSSLVVALIALGVARSISQPIINLTAITKSIISGEFRWEAPIYSNDEIGDLARSFNLMMERLNHSFQELADMNQDLEVRVEERTKSLKWANLEINLLNEKLQEDNLRMSSELEITRRLQQLILPKEQELLNIPSLEIAGFMEPATEVGGDYYDVIQSNGSIRIGVGDITGHGLESGILMIMLQTAVRTLAHVNIKSPMAYINILNRVIYENICRMDTDKSLTLILLEYNQESNLLKLTGQHEEAIVVRSDGTVQCINTMDLGFPIGLEADISAFIGQVTIQLGTGDVVVLYTDGITEAENMGKQLYSQERLCRVIRQNVHQSAHQIREAIISDLRQHIGTQTVFDDITLVVIKKKQSPLQVLY
jgi:serine phosphatase RsbU (regulator of sigma subunit)